LLLDGKELAHGDSQRKEEEGNSYIMLISWKKYIELLEGLLRNHDSKKESTTSKGTCSKASSSEMSTSLKEAESINLEDEMKFIEEWLSKDKSDEG
jgi:hypothetical protein